MTKSKSSSSIKTTTTTMKTTTIIKQPHHKNENKKKKNKKKKNVISNKKLRRTNNTTSSPSLLFFKKRLSWTKILTRKKKNKTNLKNNQDNNHNKCDDNHTSNNSDVFINDVIPNFIVPDDNDYENDNNYNHDDDYDYDNMSPLGLVVGEGESENESYKTYLTNEEDDKEVKTLDKEVSESLIKTYDQVHDDDDDDGNNNETQHIITTDISNDPTILHITGSFETNNDNIGIADNGDFNKGDVINIVKGTHKGKSGIIHRTTAQKVYVDVINCNQPERVFVFKTSITKSSTHNISYSIDETPSPPIPSAPSFNKTSDNISITTDEFGHGDIVEILKGTHRGKFGEIDHTTNKMVYVNIFNEDQSETVKVYKTSIKRSLRSHHDQHQPLRLSNNNSIQNKVQQESTSLLSGVKVFVNGGSYKNEWAYLQKECPKRVKVRLVDKNKVVFVNKEFVLKDNQQLFKVPENMPPKRIQSSANGVKQRFCKLKNIDENNEWSAPDSDKGGYRLNNRWVRKIRLETKHAESHFLARFLKNRMQVFEIPLNKEEESIAYDSHIIDNNDTAYELVTVKVVQDTQKGGFNYKPKALKLVYSQENGHNIEPFSIKDELEKIADFASLDTRKVVSRLELLQSPAFRFPMNTRNESREAIFYLEKNMFCEIQDNGHEGCGFIDEDFLKELLGGGKLGENTICIQIRIFAPELGIFKGMLMKKRGITQGKIQLPQSMKKVGASKHVSERMKAVLTICQGGIDPSKYNSYLERTILDSELSSPHDLKSFQFKHLSPMITRLFRALSVSESTVNDYVQRRKNKSHNVTDTFLRGVSDPTASLPNGHVFVTGLKGKDIGHEIFVTRSPCLKWDDGKLLKIITAKPEDMSSDEYEWLQAMPFGVIIFALPSKGMKPITQTIAGGDLDGDRYFVCWDKKVLIEMKADRYKEESIAEDATERATTSPHIANIPYDKDWFKKAQDFMIKYPSHEIQQLIGHLFKMSIKAADNDPERGCRNPDAEAYANAYNDALEYGKHGTKIVLPRHLHENIPRHLQKYLTDPPE